MLHQCHKMLQEITSQIAALQLLQDNVHKDMGSFARSKNLEKSNQDLVKLLGSKTGHCDVLVEENIKLKRQIEQLQATLPATLTPPRNRSTRPASGTLILGSSIIRNFDTGQPSKTTVKSISGWRITQWKRTLDESKGVYETVVLVVGGNDCASSDDVNLMLSHYSDLIDAAHMATGGSGLVKISSVCPRANEHIQRRIDAFNAGLSQLCSDRNIEFIDNDDNFKARNGSINECLLLPDGVNLTTSGSSGVGRRNESCRHKWLLLGALNGHFLIFTLQIFCFCRHMWRCGDHLPTSDLHYLQTI